MLLRVLSAIVMLPLLLAVIFLLPPWGTLLLALIAVLLAVGEYAALSSALGVPIPRVAAAAGATAACAAFVVPEPPLAVVLSAIVVASAALAVAGGRPTRDMLAAVASIAFAALWIGIPLGTIVAIRQLPAGAEMLMPLIFTIVVSDSAQYYAGRAFGRRALSPLISPKKTVEGAIGGLVFAVPAMIWSGSRFLPGIGWEWLALLGAAVALLGMIGDLFESALKRAADMKDSSALIPGHGGVLDRLDGWFFAAPVYYAFLRAW